MQIFERKLRKQNRIHKKEWRDCHLQMLPCNLQQSICSYEKRENADNTHMLSRCNYLYAVENVLDNIKGKYIACLIAIG